MLLSSDLEVLRSRTYDFKSGFVPSTKLTEPTFQFKTRFGAKGSCIALSPNSSIQEEAGNGVLIIQSLTGIGIGYVYICIAYFFV